MVKNSLIGSTEQFWRIHLFHNKTYEFQAAIVGITLNKRAATEKKP